MSPGSLTICDLPNYPVYNRAAHPSYYRTFTPAKQNRGLIYYGPPKLAGPMVEYLVIVTFAACLVVSLAPVPNYCDPAYRLSLRSAQNQFGNWV
jgi:hypothetical protein